MNQNFDFLIIAEDIPADNSSKVKIAVLNGM